ncbi:FluC/FEX family fluoride channel [Alicyclobacillus fodiniaquatilis]|jgi:CrcB protein|uniref:Fluoride-specific ion channel FluC n=1 Tax=Alicyclobacillus fodiniaquatilis TaxID=1661150 RepID=A0ABW4JQX2_9BACL
MNYIAIFVGGIIGGIIRYLLTFVIPTPGGFALDILIINLSGCLALGIFYGIADLKNIKPWLRNGIATGVIGSYTTFSTFCVGTVSMENHHAFLGLIYAVSSIVIGPLLAYAGDFCVTFVNTRMLQQFEEETA